MSSICMRFVCLLLAIGSNVLAMDSLKRAAARSVVVHGLHNENQVGDLEEALQQEAGKQYVKQQLKRNLPESFKEHTTRYILQNWPRQALGKSFTYLDDQVSVERPGKVIGLTFVGRSQFAVLVTKNKYMQWWDTQKLKLVDEVSLSKRYFGVTSSQNGRFVGAISKDEVVLFETENRTCCATLQHDSDVCCMAFSPDTKFLAVGLIEGKIVIWDLQQQKQVKSFNGTGRIDKIQLTNTQLRILNKNTMVSWQRENGRSTTFTLPLDVGQRCISSHFINEQRAVFCMSGCIMKIFNLTDTSIRTLQLSKVDPEDGQPMIVHRMSACCFSDDERLLVLAEGDSHSIWKRSLQNPSLYEYMDELYGVSWYEHLAIRGDNFAYLASNQNGGLQLSTIEPVLRDIKNLAQAKERFSKKLKVESPYSKE